MVNKASGGSKLRLPLRRLPAWQDADETLNYNSSMKKRFPGTCRPEKSVANRVPSFEETLTFVMTNLSHSRDGLEKTFLSAKEKQRFKQMERKSDALNLDEYRDILRRVLKPGLHDMAAESQAHIDVLHRELHEFLKRYEILSWQLVPGRATKQAVLWALSHRFYLPWLALRLAFNLKDDTEFVASPDDCWFIPLRGRGLDSCVMKVIEKFVRGKNESNAELSRRFYDHFPADKQKKHAIALEGDISKYSNLKTSPSDATIDLIVECAHGVLHLRITLVLARFIDRCVRDARKFFDDGLVLELLNYFVLCFNHFRSVVKQVRSEFPKSEPGEIWVALSSRTFMGNTPGQQKHFYPLMDDHVHELARNLNEELCQTERTGKLCHLPRDEAELNAGSWSLPAHIAIPVEIEGAPFRSTVKAAVEVSRRTFSGQIDLPVANMVRRRFEFLGLGTYFIATEKHQWLCNEADAKIAEQECKRLFQLIYKQTPAPDRADVALEFLKYLVEPYRPKANEDRKLARELCKVACKSLRRGKLHGVLHYLQGCLYALEENHKKALRSFVNARKLGHESCSGGRVWIDLLRVGLVTAERVKSTRERKNFSKQARLYGIFSNDATPRSNEMQAQMNEADFRLDWTSAFRPFPHR